MDYAELPEKVTIIREKIADAVRRGGHGQKVDIVAVTKTHSSSAVTAAWYAGLRDCGENRVQEAIDKMKEVEVPVSWHLIGHLQRNKVSALGKFSLLHSLDRSRLADAINAFGLKSGRAINALVQVNTSGEDTKGGYSNDELIAEADRLITMSGINIKGVMTMAPYDASESTLRKTFQGAFQAREILRAAGHTADHLSMGMSGDYEIAVEEGATIVRLGSILFGERE